MSKLIYILNGPNLNRLGTREPHIYGSETLEQVKQRCSDRAAALGLTIDFRQSNFEGAVVESVHEAVDKEAAGIIINPAGLTFTSTSLMDALKMFSGPRVELHITNVHARDAVYHNSLISKVATAVVAGMGTDGYIHALDWMAARTAKA
ncbi:3-dehydroquinate dehydratase [Variovorax paradoxus]|uniref:3-dehydroquinate dehydratase n=1 Tax=Variovorax paradoxus TaxID=34073 RepID=A0AA91I9S6_VARPD|nr:type II 3-dehydroquinate dehydratase [Variovorax paradoxus]OAK61411.1 3-dehydroquinate dehydratase [Variovorax paradoxus]